MSADDDEALSWAGDESLADPRERGRRSPRREPRVVIDGAHLDAPRVEETDGPPQTGAVTLVLLSLLSGILLLDVAGWVLAIGPLQAAFRPLDVLGTVMFSLGLGFAVAAPALWFVASLWFTRSRPASQRLAALVVGVLLLVPWPFLVGVPS